MTTSCFVFEWELELERVRESQMVECIIVKIVVLCESDATKRLSI